MMFWSAIGREKGRRNSMAVPVMKWIGKRIKEVNNIKEYNAQT